MDHPEYAKKLHDPCLLADYADRIADAIKTYSPTAKAIAIRGYSGAIMGGVISVFTEIPLIIIRKDHEECHSDYFVQGENFGGDYVIVDDLISSGKTIDEICWKIDNDAIYQQIEPRKCVGIFLYEHGKYSCYNEHFVRECLNWNYTGKITWREIPVYIVDGELENVS